MKKIITFLLLITFSVISFSQQNETTSKQDYLKKSKSQKTAAWILLGAGFLSTIIGVAPTGNNPDYNDNSARTGFLIPGVVAIGASIPLFIASGKNKRKAMSMSLKIQKVPQLQKIEFVSQAIPSLNLKINL